MKHFIGCEEGLIVRTGLHIVKDEAYMDGNESIAVILVVRLVVHSMLQSSGCVVGRPTEGGYTRLKFPICS